MPTKNVANTHLAATVFYTTLALFAFAGNSLLCRMALAQQHIDAASFTSIRLVSGSLMLIFLYYATQSKVSEVNTKSALNQTKNVSWLGAMSLFIYALFFSYAYLDLATGTGALILFSFVQLSIVVINYFQGNKVSARQIVALVIALCGLSYLVYPDLQTPSFLGFILMAIAGIAWAVYTIIGKKSLNALADTRTHFIRTTPLVIMLAIVVYVFVDNIKISPQGFILAAVSGVITSGLGYFLWFKSLKYLTSLQAGILQLLVPIIAIILGIVFLNEAITTRLIIATAIIITGIYLLITNKSKKH